MGFCIRHRISFGNDSHRERLQRGAGAELEDDHQLRLKFLQDPVDDFQDFPTNALRDCMSSCIDSKPGSY